jgi:hypothetical protein
LDGRIRFHVALSPRDEQRFRTQKVREIVLVRAAGGGFELAFNFSAAEDTATPSAAASAAGALPAYVRIEAAA